MPIRQTIMAFYNPMSRDPNHRYRSWEHCYSYFRRHNSNDFSKDTAALHLAFYLASWGMYRASSPLLWKDYRIHLPAIKVLLKPNFSELWNLTYANAQMDDRVVKLILKLSNELKEKYAQTITIVNGRPRRFEPSNTLITKVLLGTLGCTPACDRFFIRGFRTSELSYSTFNGRFLHKVVGFYREHQDDFYQAQQAILRESHIRYPVMKLVDMYFWKTGVEHRARARGR